MVSAAKPIDNRINESIKTYEGNKGDSRNPDPDQTETAGTKRGRGRPRKSAAAEKTIVPRMVDVEVPTPDEPAPAPRPAAPKKKPTKAAAAKRIGVTGDNLTGIIKACGDIVGNREGYEIWKLDDKECQQLAEPLSRIIARSEYLERITDEYGDYIALTIAASTVIIPRLLVQAQTNKENKKNDIEKQKEKKINDKRTPDHRTEGNENRTIGTSDRRFNESATYGDKTINPEFHKSIPIIQG
jgi:hypothetical protein